MHMRSTLNLDDDLIEEAKKLTGIQEKKRSEKLTADPPLSRREKSYPNQLPRS